MKYKFLLVASAMATLVVGATAASADIACNREGDCWHTDTRYNPPGVSRFDYHPDDWYFHRHWQAEREHHWRDYHEGRGYWRNGVWVTF